MPYLLLSESFPVTARYAGISRVWGCLESGGWAKGTKTKEKRWMVWVRRWKRAWWTIHYLKSLLSGGCHWLYKFMIWKTGKRRHAVMDGMMVTKGVHRFILYLLLALLHTCAYIWHESWVHLWTPSLVKYSAERELEGQAHRSCRCYSQHKKVRVQEEATSTWRELISQPLETDFHNCQQALAKAEINWISATNCNAVKSTNATDKLENIQANNLHNVTGFKRIIPVSSDWEDFWGEIWFIKISFLCIN